MDTLKKVMTSEEGKQLLKIFVLLTIKIVIDNEVDKMFEEAKTKAIES